MGFITFLVQWGVLGVLLLVNVALGCRLLHWVGIEFASRLERLLCAAGLGFGTLVLWVFGLGTAGMLTKSAVLLLLVGMALSAGSGWHGLRDVVTVARRLARTVQGSSWRLCLCICIAGCLTLDALMAMAPLTGSDAMHYHFTVPRIWAQQHGFFPVPWIANSFFTGHGHMLVTLGLTLGSDRFALGLIYFVGVLTVVSTFALALRLLSLTWALLAVLALLLAPMTYWQISVAGTPDIWMGFYTVLALMLLTDAVSQHDDKRLVLAGIFAGLATSGKYIAWATPLIFALLIGLSTRSWRATLRFAVAATAAGVYPAVRNYLWTNDPFFPFLVGWTGSETYNAYTWHSVVADTHAPTFGLDVLRLLLYPFLMVVQGESSGVGHYFGPLVLSFVPVMFLPWKIHRLYRIALFFSVVFSCLTPSQARWRGSFCPFSRLCLCSRSLVWQQWCNAAGG